MHRHTINTTQAPAAIGPYSQGIIAHGPLLFTAGQIGIDPLTGQLVEGGVKEQTRQVLSNLKAILEAAGSSLNHMVKATIFLKNLQDYRVVNEIYADYFTFEPPARSAVEVSRLPMDVLIEIECVAVVPET